MKLLADASAGNFDLGSPGDMFQGLVGLKVQNWITFIGGFLILVGVIGFFIMLLVGGVQWILAGGDKEGVEKARRRITQGAIGVVVLLSTFAIIYLVSAIFNLDLRVLKVPSL
jgi:hypothetical protein